MRKIVVSRHSLELFFIGLILIILAGFRPLEYFNDSDTYLVMIHLYDDIFQAEPTFWLINQFNKRFLGGYDQVFFLIYAFLGISLKMIAIKRGSIYPLLSVYIYLCFYLILHDMTQIRVGVASGLFLLAIPDLANKDLKKYYLKTAIAMTFHYSAVIMVFLYFLKNNKINKSLYAVLPILGIALSLLGNTTLSILDISSSFLPSFLSTKINTYILLLDDGVFNELNIYSIFSLSLIALYYFFLLNLRRIESRQNIILIKIFAIQLFTFYAFSSVPVIAGRVSEFLGISIVFLLPQLMSIFKTKIITLFFIIMYSSTYLIYIVSHGLIKF